MRKNRITGVCDLRFENDQICRVWRGRAKDCDPSFYVLHRSDTTALLYRDGKLVPFCSYQGGAVYPFSKDPLKKKPFFQRSVCKEAAFVCVSKGWNHDVAWGVPNIPFKDKRTGRSYQMGLSGVFYYELGGDPLQADKIYREFFSQGDGEAYQRKFREFIRDRIAQAVKYRFPKIFENFLENTDFVLEPDVKFLPKQIFDISRMLMEEIASYEASYLYFEYGIHAAVELNRCGFIHAMICKEL